VLFGAEPDADGYSFAAEPRVGPAELGTQAVDEVRRRVQQEIHGHGGRKNDPLYGIRTILRWGGAARSIAHFQKEESPHQKERGSTSFAGSGVSGVDFDLDACDQQPARTLKGLFTVEGVIAGWMLAGAPVPGQRCANAAGGRSCVTVRSGLLRVPAQIGQRRTR
jgi:hypothetical protein